MKISTRVRYAVRMMLDLALSTDISPVQGKEISERQGISLSYLDNLMVPLRKHGLIRTVRGPGGGFMLAKPPAQIKMSDIWAVMAGPICLIDCTHQPESCPRYEQCLTRNIWLEAEQALYGVLESWSLEDMKNMSNLDRSKKGGLSNGRKE